jgi:hypothetical protein
MHPVCLDCCKWRQCRFLDESYRIGTTLHFVSCHLLHNTTTFISQNTHRNHFRRTNTSLMRRWGVFLLLV